MGQESSDAEVGLLYPNSNNSFVSALCIFRNSGRPFTSGDGGASVMIFLFFRSVPFAGPFSEFLAESRVSIC